MPHIHCGPGEHDLTTSAYILRRDTTGNWLSLLHAHKKLGKLLQIGGHVELSETPWQALAHELREESGYGLEDLDILQPHRTIAQDMGQSVVHPVPFAVLTHPFGALDHYHTDLSYVFVADSTPSVSPEQGESTVLVWLNPAELALGADRGEVLKDAAEVYKTALEAVESLRRVPASNYSLEQPKVYVGDDEVR